MPPPLPTRVIDIGPPDGSQEPFLFDGKGIFGQYLTLSYYWGAISTSSRSYRITVKSIPVRRERIPLLMLPKTIKDAVIITRKFEVRYLWVDAICIIQDSDSDWILESSRMSSIYRNALFTIATEHAADYTKGYFAARNGLRNRHCQLYHSSGEASASSNRDDVWVYYSGASWQGREDRVLSSRAWVLQEQVLSGRVLRYGSLGISWQCVTLDANEFHPDVAPNGEILQLHIRTIQRSLIDDDTTLRATRTWCERSNGHLWQSIHSGWHHVIENYTARGISRLSDKWIAVSVISRALETSIDDICLAGLWRHWLWINLLWYLLPLPFSYRPKPPIAPS
jgi:hypothetical protein